MQVLSSLQFIDIFVRTVNIVDVIREFFLYLRFYVNIYFFTLIYIYLFCFLDHDVPFPPSDNKLTLANEMGTFFIDKLSSIN